MLRTAHLILSNNKSTKHRLFSFKKNQFDTLPWQKTKQNKQTDMYGVYTATDKSWSYVIRVTSTLVAEP
jgi:hypothetical protein